MSVFRRPSGLSAWITSLAVIVFSFYALSFLYFFVDDEAIPFVYAQNMDEGRGLTYNSLEGRVEGYSDFLQVLLDAVLLRVVRTLGLSKLAALEMGKALSFLCGIGIIIVTARTLRRDGASPPGLTSGLLFLALAGPLAVWSCSSLEVVPFALLIVALASVLFTGADETPAGSATWYIALATLAILARIDGFVHVTALLAAALIASDASRRRWLLRSVVAPVAGIAVTYHLARFAFFGSLLSAPLEAKVLYKLAPNTHAIVKRPEREYLLAFMDLYGFALIPAVLLSAVMVWRRGAGKPSLIAFACLVTYVAVVGDWMFGWRFVVPLLPLVAIAIGSGVSRLGGRIAWLAAVVVVAWSANAARAFAHEYVVHEKRPLWWSDRHAGARAWLSPYADLIAIARRAVTTPGERMAYNQAGLVPFILDVNNIDDLGICSRFIAGLPTADVYFTEVGRYSPLTNAPVLRAAHAYLLHENVRLIASRTDLLTSANGGHVPPAILNDHFRLSAIDASGENALYVRTDKPADRYRTDPAMFQENLAHTSRVRRVNVDGQRLPEGAIGPALPFLRDQIGVLPIRGRQRIAIRFADRDENVSALYAAAMSSRDPMTVTFGLYSASGRQVAEVRVPVGPSGTSLMRELEGVEARLLTIDVESTVQAESRLTIGDLRVQGQSAALRDYVRHQLRFPAP